MKRRFLKISIACLFVGGILFNLAVTMAFDKENDLLLKGMLSIAKADGEDPTSDVPCKDVESFGSGPQRARICVKDGAAYCQFENYNDIYASNGTCHFQ
jgi:hypothetical protein